MERPRATIIEVARAAGVSPSTVSRVLNGTTPVDPAKAARVQAAVARLGYVPNAFARSLLGHAGRSVGVLVPQLADEFYGRVVNGIEETLKQGGYHMICSLGHDDREVEAEAIAMFLETRVAGLVLFSDHVPERDILALARARHPIVLINRVIPELAAHAIRIDNVYSGALATRHLLELGHTASPTSPAASAGAARGNGSRATTWRCASTASRATIGWSSRATSPRRAGARRSPARSTAPTSPPSSPPTTAWRRAPSPPSARPAGASRTTSPSSASTTPRSAASRTPP
jgi:DNA-binding LacI/PurR family transcriptional regulator